MSRAGRAFRLALAFLTVWPVRFGEGEVGEADLAASRFAYPVVGGLIGLAGLALAAGLARLGAAPGPSAFVMVAALAVVTGGLHLDGLADTFDGLFLHGGPGRRLAVMKDPHVGSFGVVAIGLALLGKFAALGALSGPARGPAVLGAAVASRTAVLVLAGSARYARPEGTGRFLIDATRPGEAVGASGLILAVAAALAGWPGLVGGGLVVALSWGLARIATARLGGVTGDLCGAAVELAELGYLLALALVRG
jgi:adenosylcobinamide-GDP ribazoletransferase